MNFIIWIKRSNLASFSLNTRKAKTCLKTTLNWVQQFIMLALIKRGQSIKAQERCKRSSFMPTAARWFKSVMATPHGTSTSP